MEQKKIDDIRDEVREIVLSWTDESKGYMWIGDKVKLASDIQNYADKYAKEQVADYEIKKVGYYVTANRKSNIISKLEDTIGNGVIYGEEIDITAQKIYTEFVDPLLRMIDHLKNINHDTKQQPR